MIARKVALLASLVAAASGSVVVVATAAARYQGPVGTKPGTLASVPGVGRVTWSCDAGLRTASFIPGGPVISQHVVLSGDGRRLSSTYLGVRRRRVDAPRGRWTTLVFRVTQRSKPATVTVTFTMRFRVLGAPTNQCYVPQTTVDVLTRSHTVGA